MIRLDGICKSFGLRQVLDNVSFEVPGGQVTGFVGGNGAGKTTTMRIILGLLNANAGTVFLGDQPMTAALASRVGYMPEERGLYPKMKVAEQLVYLARLHGLDKAKATNRTGQLLERLGLAARANSKVEELSLGNQQRAQIAAALVQDPDVLILDEPFSGLDPMAVDTVMAVLRDSAAGGVPILFSSHQLDVVERITDNLVIIAAGQIKAAGPTAQLQQAYAGQRYWLQANGDLAWLASQPGVGKVEAGGPDKLYFEAEAPAAQAVLQQALTQGPVAGFGRHLPSLADVFREVIQDHLPDTGTGEVAP